MKYLVDDENDENDPRARVLFAVFNLLHGYETDINLVAEKGFDGNPPPECQIAIRGEGLKGEVVFSQKEGKSWTSLGCIKNNILLFKK